MPEGYGSNPALPTMLFMEGLASDLVDILNLLGRKHPKIALIGAAVFGIIGAGYTWIWPKSLSGFGILVGLMLLVLAMGTLAGSLKGFVDHAFRRSRLRSQQRLEDLHDLTWQQFEEVVADAYRGKGFRVEEVGGKNDGGIDLILHGLNGLVIPVQCKRWKEWRVGAPKVREFVGAMAGLPERRQGIYVTCGTYTQDAISLAKRHNIELIDGDKLLQLIASINGNALGWAA